MTPFNVNNAQSVAAQTFLAATAQQGTMTPGFEPTQAGGIIPGLGMFNMATQPMLASLMQQNGMIPGMFMGGGNLADMMRAEEYARRRQEAITLAAQTTDTRTWLQTTAGASRLFGLPFGLDQQAAYNRAYQQMAPMMAMLGQVAPDMVDALHGSKGSAQVMVQNMMRGSQYRMDAATGLPGMSASSLSDLTSYVEQNLYGDPARIAQMRGIGMGQLGGIFDEASRRGYLPSSLSVRSKESQLSALARSEGKDVEELRKLSDEEFGQKARQFDSQRITSRLKELAGSVSAMREIFGAMGQPDAPMSQIMNALEAMTQNKLATMPTGQVEQIVRQTKAVMESTGMGLDAINGLISGAGSYGDRLGLDRTLSIQAGQGAALFGSAYKDSFGSDFRMFGAAGAEVMMQKDALLRQNAAGSQQARYAGAVVRSVESLGVSSDSRMGRLAQALREGRTEFEGQSIYEVLRRERLSEIAEQSGVNPEQMAAFNSAMNDKFGNQEYIERYGIGNTVRKLQGRELVDRTGRVAGENAIMSALRAGGMGATEARDAAAGAGGALLQALLSTDDPEALSTAAGRKKLIEQALTSQFGAERAAQMSGSVALNFESQMTRHVQRAGYGNLAEMLQAHNTTVLEQKDKRERLAKADASISGILSPLGKAGPVQRVMDMLQRNMGDDDISDIIGTALGGIKVGDVKELKRRVDRVRELSGKTNLTESESKELESTKRELEDQVNKMAQQGRDEGSEVGRTVSNADMQRAVDGAVELRGLLSTDGEKDAKHLRSVDKQVRKQLARTNNLVQALYIDDASIQKLGVGAVDRIKSVESKYLQMMRLTGGDPNTIAKALRGDEDVPEELRKQIQSLHGNMTEEMQSLNKDLSAEGGSGMTDAELADEMKQAESVRKERMASDEEQTKSMIDQMAQLSGMDPADMSDEDRARIKGMLGGIGEVKRKDLMMAVQARKMLDTVSRASGQSLDEMRSSGKYDDLFGQAGSLTDIGAGSDEHDIQSALRDFAPRPGDKASSDATADSGKGTKRMEVVLTAGNITMNSDGTATMSGQGYTNLPMG